MKTLVIYNEQGEIVFTNTNDNVKEGEFNPLVVTVPEGKMLIGVNTETNEPIFSDIPPSEIQKLKDQVTYQEEMLSELEAALIEIAEMAMGGGNE